MRTAEYDYFLPEGLIAVRPLEQRDSSRLMVLGGDGAVSHRKFYELPEFINPGDMLVLNNSKVLPVRLSGRKPTGGKLEILLVREISPGLWNILSRENFTGTIRISEDLSAKIDSGKTAFLGNHPDIMNLLWKEGSMPLPPYIKRPPDEKDKETYQTVYAVADGSIAAPTAGLHFTKELLERLAAKSVLIRFITLHVGPGTFRPVRSAFLEEHKMEEEFFEFKTDFVSEIQEVRESGNRVIAVGTTATRALEGFFSGRCNTISSNGTIKGSTDIFIFKGYSFRIVDSLITNFHLPRSTPLVLTSAFAGREKVLSAYKNAIRMKYRFFSYGDAMILL